MAKSRGRKKAYIPQRPKRKLKNQNKSIQLDTTLRTDLIKNVHTISYRRETIFLYLDLLSNAAHQMLDCEISNEERALVNTVKNMSDFVVENIKKVFDNEDTVELAEERVDFVMQAVAKMKEPVAMMTLINPASYEKVMRFWDKVVRDEHGLEDY